MNVDPERWESVQSLFHRALERSPEERLEFLQTECSWDEDLLHQVLELLAEDERAESVLDRELRDLAGTVLDTPPLSGRLVGPYRLVAPLGEGGMGVVYLAERVDLGNRVALKMLRDAWIAPEGRARFEREQRTLAALNHPNIARLLDAGTLADGTPYFVMELVDGIPIHEYLAGREATVGERLTLFRRVCEAVQFAHRNAIVHRDIKPSNILVTADGTVKLLDFGIAKQIDELDAGHQHTKTERRMLTPAYAAPEQLRGAPVGVYTDVYSLGVLLYELLSGIAPFRSRGRTPGELEAAVLTEEPERPSMVWRRAAGGRRGSPRLSPSSAAWQDLDVICLTAIQKDPVRRYGSVEALQRDIEHHLHGEPIEARPDTLGYRTSKFVRRNSRAVAAAAAVALLVGALSAGYALRLAAEQERAQLEAAKAQQVSDYLIGLFEAADPFGTGEPVGLVELLAQGEARAEALADQPVLQAEVLDVLGRVQTVLSDYERAGSLLNRALVLRREQDPRSLEVAETLVNLGMLHFHTGEYELAESHFRESLELRRAALPERDQWVAESLDNLGVALTNLGRYDEANVYLQRALRIRRQLFSEPHEDLGQTLNNLAVNLYNLGDLAGAEAHYLEAISVDSAVYGGAHPSTATDLANLARIYQDREEYPRALALLREALSVRLEALGDEHYEVAISHSQLGGVLDAMEQLDSAEVHHGAALGIRERLLGPAHPSVATSVNGLSLVQYRRGNFVAAEAGFRRAAEIYGDALGQDHPFTGVALCNLAATLQKEGRLEESEAIYREGIAIIAGARGTDHPELAFNQYRLAELLVEMGRAGEALDLLRPAHRILEEAYGPDHRRARDAAALLVEVTARAP